MKKIPTLFVRQFENHKIVGITDEITPGCEKAFKEGIATVKYDGSCCAIIDGEFYKRYDCKKGKTPPEGAIPCCDPDPITGHWPHWVKVSPDDPGDKWFRIAYGNTIFDFINENGTYEAVGPHFQGNPYNLEEDMLIKHGCSPVYLLDDNGDHTFENIKLYLETHKIEGLVFWLDGEPVCKIKRTDFGLPWPVK
jgi:hypothetical protein